MSKMAQTALAVAIGAGVSLLIVPWVIKATFAYAHWVMGL